MKHIVATLYPRALATSLTLPMDMLRGASQAAKAAAHSDAELKLSFVADSLTSVKTTSGLSINPDFTFTELERCDMLLMPAMWRNPVPVINTHLSWMSGLERLAAAGTLICSVGTASCFLAESGLLNGKAATTHWNYFDKFSKRYPLVDLKRRHLITQAGNLYCAGSVNSIADLMIHIVEDWFGKSIATALENQFSPEIRRPFRAHAFQSMQDGLHHDELVLDAQQWLQDNLHQPLLITDLARHMDCAESTLGRRFKNSIGSSPLQYLQARRLATAKELLRASNLSVGEVAWRVGLHDVSYFTSLFKKQAGLTPARYRKSVRGKLFTNAL